MADPAAAHAEREHARRILDERTRALAQPLHVEEQAATVELVVMALATERYGVDTQYVREVLVLADLAPVPGIPAFWSGVVNVRGTLYPVLDLRNYLSLPNVAASDRLRSVVLVSAAGMTIGLMVDDTLEVRRIPAAAIGPALEGIRQAGPATIRGITDDLLAVLDIEALLADPKLVVREELT